MFVEYLWGGGHTEAEKLGGTRCVGAINDTPVTASHVRRSLRLSVTYVVLLKVVQSSQEFRGPVNFDGYIPRIPPIFVDLHRQVVVRANRTYPLLDSSVELLI